MNLGRETFTRRTFRLSAWLLAVTVMVAGCSDEISSPPEAEQGARLRITANVLTTTASLFVEVAAADLPEPRVFSIPIAERVASGTVTVPAGPDRTFTFRALDLDGDVTHSGSMTINVVDGDNPTVTVALLPLAGDQAITLSIGSVVITITPSFSTITVGKTLQLTATITDADGNEVPGRVQWGSVNASKAIVDRNGRVTAVDTGDVQIAAVAGGVAALADIEIMFLIDLAERLIATSFQVWFSGTQEGNPSMALSLTADEFTMSWGNFAGQQLSSEPRVAWPNEPDFRYAGFNEDPWDRLYEALLAIEDGSEKLRDVLAQDGPSDRVDRGFAFAEFVEGMCYGWLALMFDRAIILESAALGGSTEFAPHMDVWFKAEGLLKKAIERSEASTFTLPAEWINGNALTSTELAQLIHSQLARWLPQVARTPAERAAINWGKVIQHVDQGITEDFTIAGDGNDRWFPAMQWWGFQTDNTTWARADYKTIGRTDTSGEFDAWLATPLDNRTEFELLVPDERITPLGEPQGIGLDFGYHGASRFLTSRGTYHFSFYIGNRHEQYAAGGGFGPIMYMTVVEMQLAKAEALLRNSGPSQAVADIINATRVERGGLPPAQADESEEELMDKLTYEKRIENYGVCSGCAFFDRRGLGPLAPTGPDFHHGHVEGTPLHFPVPGRVLEDLGLPIYTFGGVGNELSPIFSAPTLVRSDRWISYLASFSTHASGGQRSFQAR